MKPPRWPFEYFVVLSFIVLKRIEWYSSVRERYMRSLLFPRVLYAWEDRGLKSWNSLNFCLLSLTWRIFSCVKFVTNLGTCSNYYCNSVHLIRLHRMYIFWSFGMVFFFGGLGRFSLNDHLDLKVYCDVGWGYLAIIQN